MTDRTLRLALLLALALPVNAQTWEAPKNGTTWTGDTPAPWGAARSFLFAQDGGIAGTRLGPTGNQINGVTLTLGAPERGEAGSPRLDFRQIALVDSRVVVRSAYLSTFSRVESIRTNWLTEPGPVAATWPSAVAFHDSGWHHADSVVLAIPDLTVDGASTFERNRYVQFGLIGGEANAADFGGCLIVARFESNSVNPADPGQTVHVGRGCHVIATYAVLTRFIRHPGAGVVAIMADPFKGTPMASVVEHR